MHDVLTDVAVEPVWLDKVWPYFITFRELRSPGVATYRTGSSNAQQER